MKILLTITLWIALFLYVSELNISFKPFSIQLPYWYRATGLLFIIAGLILYNVGERTKGYLDGLRRGSEITIEQLKNK